MHLICVNIQFLSLFQALRTVALPGHKTFPAVISLAGIISDINLHFTFSDHSVICDETFTRWSLQRSSTINKGNINIKEE